MIATDIQQLMENTYSRQAAVRMVKAQIPDELIQVIADIATNIKPKYATQARRWAELQQQDLEEFALNIWATILQINAPVTLTAMVGQIRGYFPGTPLEAVKTAGELLYFLAEKDYLDFTRGVDNQWVVENTLELDSNTRGKLDRVRYMPPMLCVPKPLRKWDDSPYLSIRTSGVILNNYNRNGDGLNYRLDHLNALNQQPLHLNVEFLQKYQQAMPEDREQARFLKDTWEVACSLIHNGNTFYLTHDYDKRGRTYTHGYHINYQGDSYHKAMIDVEPEYLTEEGEFWLKVDIANHFGLDKENFDVRLAWFHQNSHQLEDMVDQADEPALYFKAVLAYRNHQAGLPVSHPVRLDACASGAQIQGVLTRCWTTCEAVGLIGNQRKDIYSELLKHMPEGSYGRKDIKDATVPYFYASTMKPQEVFGDDVDLFYQAVSKALPAVPEYIALFLEAWPEYATEYRVTAPDGFDMVIPVMQRTDHRVELPDGSSFTHVLHHNEGKKTGLSIVANVTHMLDGWIVRRMKANCPFTLLTNHDCFGCHPNHMGVVYHQYLDSLVWLAENDVLEGIAAQFGIQITVPKNPDLVEAIKQSKYHLS